MRSRTSLEAGLMGALLAIGLLGNAPAADAAPAGRPLPNPGKSAGHGVFEVGSRVRAPRLYAPIAPSYLYYDFPYYFSRGHYPTHIRPGFIYFGRPYAHYSRGHLSTTGVRCSNGRRGCVAGWSYSRDSGSPRRRAR
jgi:hypothetical protein